MVFSAETVCSYHTAGMLYGQPTLVQSCIDWLEKTLLPLQSAELLQNIRFLLASVCLLPVWENAHSSHHIVLFVILGAAVIFDTVGWVKINSSDLNKHTLKTPI